jgi:tetratricopeptide (TPR) repeat protein
LIALLFSCSENTSKNKLEKEKILVLIQETEKIIYSDSITDINPSVANNAIMLYSKYANAFDDDTLSADYLFKAAELCKALNKSQLSLNYYEKVEQNYPSFRNMDLVIFMQGFVNEVQLKNYEKARFHYERYIAKYPKSPLCKDLRTMIENLGKSDEDLIKEFLLKENQKTS